MLRNNYQSRNLIGLPPFWRISPRNSTSFTRPFLTGRRARGGHETSRYMAGSCFLTALIWRVKLPVSVAIILFLVVLTNELLDSPWVSTIRKETCYHGDGYQSISESCGNTTDTCAHVYMVSIRSKCLPNYRIMHYSLLLIISTWSWIDLPSTEVKCNHLKVFRDTVPNYIFGTWHGTS